MPEINVGAQIFDIVFHPSTSLAYTALLTGHIKSFAYNVQGDLQKVSELRPSKKSCRGLSMNHDGSRICSVGKGKSLALIDTTSEQMDIRTRAHDVAINRVKWLMPSLLSTGDDDGVVKLWDPRTREATQAYTQHFDYITDFLWLEDKKQLVSTSGDGTLSVIDVRSKKAQPTAQSEDQEDELLSITAIKGGSKIVVGTQLGILSIFNRSRGWGDCVDRIPGHPLSVDALCPLPLDFPHGDPTRTVLTGSSDGFVRAVEILPTKPLGVLADHGEWSIERIAIGTVTSELTVESGDEGRNAAAGDSRVGKPDSDSDLETGGNQRKWWVGSVGHDEVLRLTDLEGFYLENAREEEEDTDDDDDDDSDGVVEESSWAVEANTKEKEVEGSKIGDKDASDSGSEENSKVIEEDEDEEDEEDESSEAEEPAKPEKRKREAEKQILQPVKKAKGKKALVIDKSFFNDM